MLSSAALLAWYDRHRRRLPWRALPGAAADPYRVWLSEIMLQQTTVISVIPYYENFLRRFPDIETLAAAAEEAVLQSWAGLGYYARARNLLACARAVVARGGFPRDPAGLRALPGIGPYTANAIAAIAFAVPVIPVDGNVERVLARVHAIETPLPALKRDIAARAGDLDSAGRPADFAQALFDLGATICTPASPECPRCPWRDGCAARARGLAAELPRKAPRRPRPLRHGALFRLADANGQVLLRRRPSRGLLGGMAELPGTAWRADPWAEAEALAHAPMPAEWRRAGQVRHVFTHFELHLDVFAAEVAAIAPGAGFLCGADELAGEALPSVMRKCLAIGLTRP